MKTDRKSVFPNGGRRGDPGAKERSIRYTSWTMTVDVPRADVTQPGRAYLLPLALLALLLGCSPALDSERRAKTHPHATVDDLSWLLGRWVGQDGDRVTSETWTRDGEMLVGEGRTTVAGETVFTEALRIEPQAQSVVYVASPQGQATAIFPLTQLRDRRAVFANPAHDHPTSIAYWRENDTLHARIDGPQGPSEWTLRRAR